MRILVTYDGTIHSKAALRYGIAKTRAKEGELLAAHVFNSNLFVDYNAGPWAVDTARKESAAFAEEAGKIMAEEGADLSARVVELEGDPVEEILSFAGERRVDLIIATPNLKSLVRSAPCPVSIVPGTILVPVDNTESCLSGIVTVEREALSTGSRVLILGIVPEHLFSSSEKDLVSSIGRDTASVLEKAKELLMGKGLKVEGLLRSGYPDEEILKVAEKNMITSIIIPEGGEERSELAKAAAIIQDEPERNRNPLVLVPASDCR
jgi:nucleotide-binding universal stress UspA family protein